MSWIKTKDFFASRLQNLVLFIVAVSLAFYMKWHVSDLAWSLWLSNLFITGAVIASTTAIVAQKEAAYALIGIGLFLFSISFHLGQTIPLFATVPYGDTPLVPQAAKETLARIFMSYWTWLPIAFYHSKEAILNPPNPLKPEIGTNNPYKSFLFFTLLIYILIGFNKLLGLNGPLAIVLVYFFYFFLFDRDLTRKRHKNNP